MAAQVLQLTEVQSEARPIAEIAVPSDHTPAVLPLPFPAPLLHPRSMEALLLAFRPLDEEHGRR